MRNKRTQFEIDFAASGEEPFENFVGIPRNMQEAGLVSGVDNYLRDYDVWASNLNGDEAEHLAITRENLGALRTIETTHGHGVAVNLDHPTVANLRKWGRLSDGQIGNAAAFKALADHCRQAPA